jgi:hypothetical protein
VAESSLWLVDVHYSDLLGELSMIAVSLILRRE